ncbi:hypothetical protein ACFV9E_06390 [Streptomyces sp. NPDC059835]|uniref:hypothetical protein n=1 Tax=Streptomyces sp. NPDC059835 TaxID=3346967 RepID=UPI0036681A3F
MTGPTREQLLVLADRAERGQLTAAEAGRLRQGITALYAERRTAGGRTGVETWRQREITRRLLAVQEVIRAARQREARTIPVRILAAAVGGDSQLPTPGPRPRASVPA